jgi:hypothetical protein
MRFLGLDWFLRIGILESGTSVIADRVGSAGIPKGLGQEMHPSESIAGIALGKEAVRVFSDSESGFHLINKS